MGSETANSRIPTRLFIISDTHGRKFNLSDYSDVCADVALHCGDLTDGSTIGEFEETLKLLRAIQAPLKLIIAGNHDFTLDENAFKAKITEAIPPLDPDLIAQYYGEFGQARRLLNDAKSDGIILLDEGTHHFDLANGAQLTVYASPYTPSYGGWGFQYHPERGHHFDIQPNTDIVMTHGPPKGIMDYTNGGERAGCADLFEAVAINRPLVHCFGHIHEGWGARYVTWKDIGSVESSHFTAIDNASSPTICKLAHLDPHSLDTPEETDEKIRKVDRILKQRHSATSHCAQDRLPLERHRQTLFINAAVTEHADVVQQPWLVDIELCRQQI